MNMANPVGRPKKWTDPKFVEALAEQYFLDTPEEEWTITGLALALDATREVLMDYEKTDEFSDTIKKMKLRVQNAYEKDLRKKGRSGDIFALKNFGWRDQQHVDQTTNGKDLPTPLLHAIRNNNSNTEVGEDEGKD